LDDLFFGSQWVARFFEGVRTIIKRLFNASGWIMNWVTRQVKRTRVPRHLGYHTEITVLSAAVGGASMKNRDIGVFPI
jgi:hypothetical protein